VAFVQLVVYGSGGFVTLANANIHPSESVMIWAAKNLVPDFVGALLLAGIMAAALSSASTFLSLVGFSASNDIVRHEESDQKKSIRFSRIVMFGVGVIALISTLIFPPSIFWVTYFVGTVFASSWGPVALMSVWSSSITKDGAFWGIISGFVFNVVPTALNFVDIIDLPSYLDPILIGAVVSLVVTVLVSRRGTVTREEEHYRMRLHRTPDKELDLGKTKTTLLAPLILVVYGCSMPFILYHWYILPYQRGTGQILPDGSVNWWTGEALLTLSWPLLYISLGLITYRIIRRSYSPGAKQLNNAESF
jgi:sodium/pantothenate symporter